MKGKGGYHSLAVMRVVLATLAAIPVAALSANDQAQQGAQLQAAGVAAIRKVIQMLSDMQAKSKKEKNDEEVAFSEFSQWCKMETSNLKRDIKKSTSSITDLAASIAKLDADAKKLGEEIGDLQGQISKHEANMKARKLTRAKERKDYLDEAKNFAESISALERAIFVLGQEDYDRKGKGSAAALLQVAQMHKMPESARALIASFLGDSDDGDDDGFGDYKAPEAHAYEFQSGAVVNMLKSLLDSFRTKKTQVDKEEANAHHAFNVVMQDLTETVDDANREISAKTESKANKQEKSAEAKKLKQATELTKAEDVSTLKDLDTECTEKTQSFNGKQQLRSDEIEAIGKAIEIMSSSDLTSFIESAGRVGRTMQGVSFAQLRSGVGVELASKGKHHDVREFIEHEGKRLKSHMLSMLVERLDADPFAKITSLIREMLERLMKEANADAEHEGYCDTEMGKSKRTRTQLTEDIDSLTASVEDAKAFIMSLTQENADLTKSISALKAAQGEAGKMRSDENKRNAATVADAEAAMKAVDAAVAVLKDFYAKAAEATSLVQGGNLGAQVLARRGVKMGTSEWHSLASSALQADAKPKQTFGDVYKGNQDGATGVLAMLEVIQSDFARLKHDTEASEASNLKSYNEFMVETKKNLAVKNKKVEMNEKDIAEKNTKMQGDMKDLKTSQDWLLTAQKYYSKLQGQCTAKSSSYEDRARARSEEIQSLREALKMLR